MAKDLVELFPARSNVGAGGLTAWHFPAKLAQKLIASKLWSATPKIKNEKDVAELLSKGRAELMAEASQFEQQKAEFERMKQELEDLKAQLLTDSSEAKKAGRPKKTEV
jgi:hypothetical protein